MADPWRGPPPEVVGDSGEVSALLQSFLAEIGKDVGALSPGGRGPGPLALGSLMTRQGGGAGAELDPMLERTGNALVAAGLGEGAGALLSKFGGAAMRSWDDLTRVGDVSLSPGDLMERAPGSVRGRGRAAYDEEMVDSPFHVAKSEEYAAEQAQFAEQQAKFAERQARAKYQKASRRSGDPANTWRQAMSEGVDPHSDLGWELMDDARSGVVDRISADGSIVERQMKGMDRLAKDAGRAKSRADIDAIREKMQVEAEGIEDAIHTRGSATHEDIAGLKIPGDDTHAHLTDLEDRLEDFMEGYGHKLSASFNDVDTALDDAIERLEFEAAKQQAGGMRVVEGEMADEAAKALPAKGGAHQTTPHTRGPSEALTGQGGERSFRAGLDEAGATPEEIDTAMETFRQVEEAYGPIRELTPDEALAFTDTFDEAGTDALYAKARAMREKINPDEDLTFYLEPDAAVAYRERRMFIEQKSVDRTLRSSPTTGAMDLLDRRAQILRSGAQDNPDVATTLKALDRNMSKALAGYTDDALKHRSYLDDMTSRYAERIDKFGAMGDLEDIDDFEDMVEMGFADIFREYKDEIGRHNEKVIPDLERLAGHEGISEEGRTQVMDAVDKATTEAQERYGLWVERLRKTRDDALGKIEQAKRPRSALQTPTQTPAFKRWFGRSKVVDEAGEPMRVYHGTSSPGIDSFDTYDGKHGLFGQGGYFTDSPKVASGYAETGVKKAKRRHQEPSPNVMPVHLSIKNPIDMDALADQKMWTEALADSEAFDPERIFRFDLPENPTNEQVYKELELTLTQLDYYDYEGAEILRATLEDMGFDGITHKGGGRTKAGSEPHQVYVAFHPEQIKSSTGNRGTFDPNDPNITRGLVGGAGAAAETQRD